MSSSDVLESQLGKIGWYSAEAEKLTQFLTTQLNTLAQNPQTPFNGLILPHAGYAYCGDVMAHGFHHVQSQPYDRIIIIGPSHYKFFQNQASTLPMKYYSCPLGKTPIDLLTVQTLLKNPLFKTDLDIHQREHSIQIYLPYLKHLWPDTPIVPIVIGDLDDNTLSQFTEILQSILTENTLLIISSDFTHYGATFGYRPFLENVATNINLLDSGAIDCIVKNKLSDFKNYIQKTKATICGRQAIQILLSLAPQNSHGQLLQYNTSGNLTGDWRNSVSYAAIGFQFGS